MAPSPGRFGAKLVNDGAVGRLTASIHSPFVEYLTESPRLPNGIVRGGRGHRLRRGKCHGRHEHKEDAADGAGDDRLRGWRRNTLRYVGVAKM